MESLMDGTRIHTTYNTTKHDGLLNRYSPFEIVFLRKNLLPNEILQGKTDPQYNVDDYVKECKLKLKLKIGDLVKIIKGPYEKFKYIYDGPYEFKQINGKNIEIRLENGTLYTIHKNRIIKY